MSDFKKGDKVYIRKESDWDKTINHSGIYTFERYNSVDWTIGYIKENAAILWIKDLKKIKHYDTKLGKILYK